MLAGILLKNYKHVNDANKIRPSLIFLVSWTHQEVPPPEALFSLTVLPPPLILLRRISEITKKLPLSSLHARVCSNVPDTHSIILLPFISEMLFFGQLPKHAVVLEECSRQLNFKNIWLVTEMLTFSIYLYGNVGM